MLDPVCRGPIFFGTKNIFSGTNIFFGTKNIFSGTNIFFGTKNIFFGTKILNSDSEGIRPSESIRLKGGADNRSFSVEKFVLPKQPI